ncbi:MAG TPA: hypothetical protein DD740_10675 [Chryseobacterium sp.]|nr:hypothetical protein HER18_01640 [Chryseobacterium sp. NEB161]HBR12635.1 hypothetical protein [Chryseobacterium sp.]
MKKTVILLASVVLLVSCNLPQGGNKRVLKQTEDVVAYNDPGAPHGTYKPTADSAKAVQPVVSDSAKTVTNQVKPSAAAEVPKTEH